MLDGVNDSPAQARELARLLRGSPGQAQSDSIQSLPGHALPALARRGHPALSGRTDPAAACSRPSAARAAMISTPPAASWPAGSSTAPRFVWATRPSVFTCNMSRQVNMHCVRVSAAAAAHDPGGLRDHHVAAWPPRRKPTASTTRPPTMCRWPSPTCRRQPGARQGKARPGDAQDPGNPNVHSVVACCLTAWSITQRRESEFRDALRRTPREPGQVLNNYGVYLCPTAASTRESSCSSRRRTMRSTARRRMPTLNVGVCLRAAKRYDEAAANFNQALALRPNMRKRLSSWRRCSSSAVISAQRAPASTLSWAPTRRRPTCCCSGCA